MANILFELISPERALFSGEVRAVMLPATEGDMTVMPGHEATMVMLNPGVIAVTDVQGHGHRAFVRGGFVEITRTSVSVLAERALPPEELTKDRLDEEIVRLVADGDDAEFRLHGASPHRAGHAPRGARRSAEA